MHPIARLPREWEERVLAWGEPAYRGKQVFDWIHRKGVLDPDEMSNVPKALRERLKEEGVGWPLEVVSAHESADRTKKLLVGMPDGEKVETVLIPQLGDATVVTQCISSQVGCAMGCVFCASGVAGLKRQMSDAEIVAQVLLGRRELGPDQRIRNVVFMGMGEPLHNYDGLTAALRLLLDPQGFGLSRKRITVSTSGLAPAIEKLAASGLKPRLAVSLNASTDAVRSKLMPINRRYPIKRLVEACRTYARATGDPFTFEYVLLAGVNDSDDDVGRLPAIVRGLPAKLNLIPFNPVPEELDYLPPDRQRVESIRDRLLDAGLRVSIRWSRGAEARAACGQLALPVTRRGRSGARHKEEEEPSHDRSQR
jgi:23S rRNA (adenine2503-C2)-methyltransferase